MPSFLLKGAKLLSIEFRGLKLIDSLSFLPIPLSKFTNSFDLKELKKGFWPHTFNTRQNNNYKGPWPEPKYYGIDFKKLNLIYFMKKIKIKYMTSRKNV